MKKNWVVSVGFYDPPGGYDEGDTWSKEYGLYSQEDAERIAMILNEKENRQKYLWFFSFTKAVARECDVNDKMCEMESVDGIIGDMKKETAHLSIIVIDLSQRPYYPHG